MWIGEVLVVELELTAVTLVEVLVEVTLVEELPIMEMVILEVEEAPTI